MSNTRATVQVRQRLSTSNRRDFFTFTLTSNSRFRASLGGINRNANVDLLLRGAGGQVLASSRKPGNSSESVTQQLAAGSYTLEARLKGRVKTRYRLTASSQLTPSTGPVIGLTPTPTPNPTLTPTPTPTPTPGIPADGAGNTLTSARLVSLSATPSLFSDTVSGTDSDDFYVFTVGDASNPSVRLNVSLSKGGQNSGVTINLRDGLGNVIDTRSLLSTDTATAFTKTLAAGTYYAQVNTSRDTPAPYTLNLSANPIPDTAGNTIANARAVNLSPTPTSITEFVGTGDPADLYQFTIGSAGAPTGQVALELRGVNGNVLTRGAIVRLYDNLGNVIDSETANTSTLGTSINRILGAGTYFVEVVPSVSSTEALDYTLNMTANPIADLAGNTRATARPVSVSSTPISFTDFVGAGDGEDFYQFTLTSNQTVNFKLGGASGQATSTGLLYNLQDSLGNSISGIPVSAGATADFSRSLTGAPSGTTYYIRIAPSVSSSQGTTYGLTLATV